MQRMCSHFGSYSSWVRGTVLLLSTMCSDYAAARPRGASLPSRCRRPMMALLLALVVTQVYVMNLSADASRLRFAVVVDGMPYLLVTASLVRDVLRPGP